MTFLKIFYIVGLICMIINGLAAFRDDNWSAVMGWGCAALLQVGVVLGT